MKNMLEDSNVSSQGVLEESSRGLSTGEKMNIEVIQNYFLNNNIALAFLITFFLPNSPIIYVHLTAPLWDSFCLLL